jgi:putative membrane protein
MRSRLCFTLLLLLTMSACRRDKEEDVDRSARRPTARRDSVVRKPIYPEAEAAQILRALNEGVIATSRIARERSQNDDVLRFASVMISDHRAMTSLLDSLTRPVPDTVNPESRSLREAGEQMVDSLWKIPAGFNNTYMELHMREHQRALQLLDTALIPSARTPQLKKLLQDLRPAIVAHLQRARQIWTARMAAGLGQPQPRRPITPTVAPTEAPRETPPPAQPQPQPQPQQPAPPPDTMPPPTSTSNM